MAYQMYRNTSLGTALQDSLNELLLTNQISAFLARKVLEQYDKSINEALEKKVKNRHKFTAKKLVTYKFCDQVWTLCLTDVTITENETSLYAANLKIVACEAKNKGTNK